MIVQVPPFMPVTTPEEETLATEVSLEDHLSVLFVAFDGETVPVSVKLFPTLTDALVLLRDTEVVAIITV